MSSSERVRKAKRNTYFSIVVTFFIGIIVTLLTAVPGPWDDWVEDKEKQSGKK